MCLTHTEVQEIFCYWIIHKKPLYSCFWLLKMAQGLVLVSPDHLFLWVGSGHKTWHTKVIVRICAMLCQTVLCWPWKDNHVVQHGMAWRSMAWKDHIWMPIELWPAYTHITYCFPEKRPCTSGLRWTKCTNSCQKHHHLLLGKSPPGSSRRLREYSSLYLVSLLLHPLDLSYVRTSSTKVCLSILC